MRMNEALKIKRKNTIFNSVFITGQFTSEGYPIIEVEPYDDTFLNATKYPSLYDKTTDRIFKAVYNYFNSDVWVIIDTDNFGHEEHLLNEYSMKEIYNLI